MKKILLCAAFIAVSFTSIAQVGIGTTTPHDSAVLEISSNEKGLLIPRMTTAQRDEIAAVEGLMVYVMGDVGAGVAGSFMYYDGNNWKQLFRADLTIPEIISAGKGKDDLYENSGEQQVVYTILVNTAITGEITYFLEEMGETDTPLLRLDDINKINVILIADPDFEDQEIYNFKVRAVSAAGKSSEWKAVSFSILPINEPPVAKGDAETVTNSAEPVPTTINVIDNDEDIDFGDILKLTYVKATTGLVTINDDEKSVNYTPAPNFNGTEIITYTVSDDSGLKAEGTLAITVFNTIKSDITVKYWMDRNLGATQVATGSDDVLSYGYLYQWGRGNDGHELKSSETSTTQQGANTNVNFISGNKDWLATKDNFRWIGQDGVAKGAYDPCPTKFRLPTDRELRAEIEDYHTRGNDQHNLIDNLKFTLAGRRNYLSGEKELESLHGYYWTSTFDTDFYPDYTRGIMVQAETDLPVNFTAKTNLWERAFGFSVRCIKED